MSVLPCPIPARQGHEGSSKERQEKADPSGVRSHAGPKVLGPPASPGYTQQSGAQGWAGGPLGRFQEAHLPTAVLPARLTRAVPVRVGVGSRVWGTVWVQVEGLAPGPGDLAVVRVVSWPKAQAFQKGKKEKQSCGCWRSTRLEHGVLPLSLRARLRSGELSARPRGPGGRSAGVDEGPAGVRSLRFWSCSLARQRGKAKVAEQGVFLPCGAGWCGCFL